MPPLVTDDLTAFPTGWALAGHAVLVAEWGAGAAHFETAHLAFWENNPAAPQTPSPRSTTATKTYTGLPADTFVSVVVPTSWNHGSGNVGFIGMRVNGAEFTPNIGPSGGFVPNTGTTIGYGTTTAGGELTVQFAVENVAPTFSVNIHWHALEIVEGYVAPEFFDAVDFADLIIDSAQAYVNESQPLSISRGSLSFDPRAVYEPLDFDGRVTPVSGCDELVSLAPMVTGNLMLSGEPQIAAYFPGGSWAGSTYGRTYTPATPRTPITAVLTGFRCVWKRMRGDFIEVRFPKALMTAHALGSQDRDEGLFAVTIEARQNLTADANPRTTPAMFYDILPVGAEV